MADYSSPFSTGIQFLDRLGVYEVLLPFLLVFTLVFAILEKTQIFGTVKIDGKDYTKKNLNSMFAFTTAFIVVASSRLVATINEAIANMVLLLVLGIAFVLSVGLFMNNKDIGAQKIPFAGAFKVIMFAGIVIVFLHALKTTDGTPWLYAGWDWAMNNVSSGVVGAIVVTALIVLFMAYITKEPGKPLFGGGNHEGEN